MRGLVHFPATLIAAPRAAPMRRGLLAGAARRDLPQWRAAPKNKQAPSIGLGACDKLKGAATYSPTRLPGQYHRRRRA